jgi:molecular chaperone DnaK (HSP70)
MLITDKNSLSLTLNDEKTKVNVLIDGNKTHELFPKVENDEIKIYNNSIKKTIGLIVKHHSEKLSVENYHPKFFNMHREKKITIKGFWKYYPFKKITSIFEYVFLENFFQKIKKENFSYVRLLHDEKSNDIVGLWLKCKRSNVDFDVHDVVDFKEIEVQINNEEIIDKNFIEKQIPIEITEESQDAIESKTIVSANDKEELIRNLKTFLEEIPSFDLPENDCGIICGRISEIIKDFETEEPDINKIKESFMVGFKIIEVNSKAYIKFKNISGAIKICELLNVTLT